MDPSRVLITTPFPQPPPNWGMSSPANCLICAVNMSRSVDLDHKDPSNLRKGVGRRALTLGMQGRSSGIIACFMVTAPLAE